MLHVFSGDLWAGAEVMIFTLLRELRTRPDLRLVALSLNDGILVERLREAGIETHVLPEGRLPFPLIVARALGLARRVHADVIHSHRYKENLVAWMLAKGTAARALVSTLHGMPEAIAEARSAGARSAIHRVDLSLLRRSFDAVVAVSRELRDALVERHGFSPERVHVIHNGIALPGAQPAAPRAAGAPIRVGSVGRLVPVKNFALFVEVADAVTREAAGVEFSILGGGPLRAHLEALAAARGGRLHFLEPVSDPAPYYRSLDVYVSTSHHEGLPLSVIEAMACGVPVVAPRVGGIPEIVVDGEQGFLVDSHDPSEFARRILDLVRDPALRREMGDRAAQRVRSDFSAAGMADRYRALYRARLPTACQGVPA